MQTYGTGRPFQRVPAKVNRNSPQEAEKMHLLISTERLADLVLLRIDKKEAQDADQPAP